jgi:hypothetical protein
MKVALFTMSFGKYDIFFDELYKSTKEFLLPNVEKKYFLFSDKQFENKDDLVQVYHEKMGWPYDTMMRFHLMSKLKDQLMEYDYMFFLNINMKAISPIGNEIIPNKENDFLMGCQHPLHYDWDLNRLPYERNPKSSLHIPYNQGTTYYQGCFNGGRTDKFLEMAEVLKQKIKQDHSNNIIPIWHDESALNWYYKDKNPLTLPYSYIYPEGMNLLQKPIMIQRDKWKYMNREELRK